MLFHRKIFVLVALVASLTGYSHNSMADPCTGKLLNPITDIGWNNMFPVTVAGVQFGGGEAPSSLHMPAICACHNAMGITVPGIGATFFEPTYIAEVSNAPGCLHTFNGATVLANENKGRRAGKDDSDGGGLELDHRNVHWYIYPVFTMLKIFTTLGCLSYDGWSLADMTEAGADIGGSKEWYGALGGYLYFPESILFANPIGDMACIAEQLSLYAGRGNIDFLFWCSGAQHLIFPPNSQSTQQDPRDANIEILSSFIIKKHRNLGLMTTVGPSARCRPQAYPYMLKSQYRLDIVWPKPRHKTYLIGQRAIFTQTPLPSTPTEDMGNVSSSLTAQDASQGTSTTSADGFKPNLLKSQAFLIWRGRQCCIM